VNLAGCIIKDSNSKILLIHRNTPKRVQWEIPGGGVDNGDTLEQTAVRELKEELDVTVRIIRQIGSKAFEEDGRHYEYHWFEARVVEGQPRLTNVDEDTYDKLDYLSISDMRTIFNKLSANTKNFVQAVQDGDAKL